MYTLIRGPLASCVVPQMMKVATNSNKFELNTIIIPFNELILNVLNFLTIVLLHPKQVHFQKIKN